MKRLPVDKGAVARVTLLFALTLVAFVLQRHELLFAGTVLCAAYALLANRRSPIKPEQLLIGLAVGALFLPAFFKPYFGLTPQFYFFNTVATFLAALAVTRHPPEVLLSAFRIVYGVSIALVAVVLYTYWGTPQPLGEVIEGSSTNGIPSYLIVIQVGLSLCHYLVRRQLPLWSALATCVVAFYGYGRGSLVVSAMLLVFSVLFDILLWRAAAPRRRVLLALLVSIAVGALAWYGEDLGELLNDYTKFGVGLVDVNRLEIWDQYVDKIDAWTLLFGADYAGTVIETVRVGNPHISFIRTHALFGLPATVLAIASPALVFFSRKTNGAKLVFATFTGLAALRAGSEPILFPTLLDLYYFSFFFMFFRYAPDRRVPAPANQRLAVAF